MKDIRNSLKYILKNKDIVDVLLINTPSTFYYNPDKVKPFHKSAYEYLDSASNNSSKLYGDQDIEVNHGLLLILAYLKNNNINTGILDINTMLHLKEKCSFQFDDKTYILESIAARHPKIIAISSMTPNLHVAKKYSKLIKKHFPDVQLVLGGMATSDVDDCLKNSFFDIVIRGEGEILFLKLVQKILMDSEHIDIDIIYRNGSKNKRDDLNTESIVWYKENNLIADYSCLPLELELIPRVFSSRGCGNGCGFCSPAKFFGGKVQMRNPEKVFSEIKYLHKNFSFEWFLLGDLNFYIKSPQVQVLLDKLIEFNPKDWWCQLEATFLDEFNIEKLKKANCKQVAIGFEDFNSDDKSIVRKNGGKKSAKSICKMLKDAGIMVQCYWVFGLPSDTFESSLKKIGDIAEFIREGLIDTVHISYMIPYPNIPYMKLYNNFSIVNNSYKDSLGSQNSYYTAMPMHKTSHLSSNEIYLLNQLAISTCANEFFILENS